MSGTLKRNASRSVLSFYEVIGLGDSRNQLSFCGLWVTGKAGSARLAVRIRG